MADPVSATSAAAARQPVRSAAAIFTAPGDVRRHNRAATRIYEDPHHLGARRPPQGGDAIRQMEAELAARGMLNSGQRNYQEGRIRDEFGRRWRDRKRQADRISGLVPDLRGDIEGTRRDPEWKGGGADTARTPTPYAP